MQFPHDAYTPYGYLDTPTHTRNLTPRGVLRSHGAGFRWHYPAYAGSYGGQRETYRAGFRLAIDGALELASFDRAFSPYHSKNIVTFDLVRGSAHGQVTYHLVGEHALCAVCEASGAQRVSVHVEYTRLLAASGAWGESGLVGRIEDGCLVVQGFEDGDALVVWTSQPPDDIGITADAAEAAHWAATVAPGLPDSGFVPVVGGRGTTVALYGVLGFAAQQGRHFEILLARGRTVHEARRRLAEARRSAAAERARKVAEDDAFWARAPQLEGDWPAHWRRGLVYDLETLRMMVRRPIGIYRHIWDAMQIQAPRVVLAEAAIDALLLAYADPELAQELMRGVFLDAPEPNVPCSREDGSYNMVAADGSVCGTAPQWGYPWLALAWLDALRPDRAWLEELYPRLADYLDWWLAHRCDIDGWLGYACSWESGQDDSPRFGAQPLGGGHPIRHVRPVDLHAAFAHAAGTMARFADVLGRPHDRAKWATLAADFTARTGQLWNGTRYADFDVRAGQFTAVDDVMLLAPLALGLAPADRCIALRAAIQAIDPAAVTWPMFAWTAVEAAQMAGLHAQAAALAAAVCERAYGFWDAREAYPERTLPGVACEYWPPSGRCGGEGYGWGAFTTHLVLHTLMGITPTREHLVIRPNLPPAWRVPGRRYGVGLHWRDRPIGVAMEPLDSGHLILQVNSQRAKVGWGEVAAYRWSS